MNNPAPTLVKNEILSNFQLQMALHFNISLFPLHIILLCLAMYFKYNLLSLTYRVILISATLVHIFSEGIRLGLGYYGNLAENMSALSGFLITSTIIQLPVSIFLIINTSSIKLPLEYLFLATFLVFNAFEIIYAITVLRLTAQREMKKFAQLLAEEEGVQNS